MHKDKIALVTGSHGFIGRDLCDVLKEEGYAIRALVRDHAKADGVTSFYWDSDEGKIDHTALEGVDILFHLAGTGIGDKRWSAKRKAYIVENRVSAAQTLSEAARKVENPPKVAVMASAIGFYGAQEGVVNESSSQGQGFAGDVCFAMEKGFELAEARVVRARLGVVLGKGGGALSKMLVPFKCGMGGVLGRGDQPFSWVSKPDVVAALIYLGQCKEASGAVNVVAPAQDTNLTFTKTLGSLLKRPTIVPMPSFVVRLLFGQMGEELLLTGSFVSSEKLKSLGFNFTDNTVEKALKKSL